jgi:hypothetical protein
MGEAPREECVAEQSAEARDPERDHVVDDHRGGRLGGRGAVGDQRAGEASFEYAEAAGDWDQVREVPDQVPEHQRSDG